jgi:hypothetical protein
LRRPDQLQTPLSCWLRGIDRRHCRKKTRWSNSRRMQTRGNRPALQAALRGIGALGTRRIVRRAPNRAAYETMDGALAPLPKWLTPFGSSVSDLLRCTISSVATVFSTLRHAGAEVNTPASSFACGGNFLLRLAGRQGKDLIAEAGRRAHDGVRSIFADNALRNLPGRVYG